MANSEYIINVSEEDFEFEVLQASQTIPVVVDFWATWCVPCKTLGPMLEKLAEEGEGSFLLAKVNVDENPNLAVRYGIRSIPAVKAFVQGQVAAEFLGLQPEAQVREFIRGLAPSPVDLMLEKASSMLKMHQWASAEDAYRDVVEEEPGQTSAILGLAKSLLAQGRGVEGSQILKRFPASREYSSAEKLLPLASALTSLELNQLSDETPLDAAYQNSLRLAARGNIPSAMDGMLDILRQNKRFAGDQARLVLIGMLELLGEEDPETRDYRQELASILF